jgi:predicted transcriptional regulator YdeE
MSKAQRLLELMDRVKQKRRFTVQELADEFQVSYRTMWRYLQELSTLGVALYSEPGSNGGYRILEKEELDNQVEIMKKPRTTYVGYSFDAPYSAKQETEILAPRLWLLLLSHLDKIDSVKYPLQKTALALFRKTDFSYFITVEVEDLSKMPIGMTALSLPEMFYAKKTHQQTLELNQVIQTYEDIYHWISKNGWVKIDSAYHLENYGEKFNPNAMKTNFDIYVPVYKKTKGLSN